MSVIEEEIELKQQQDSKHVDMLVRWNEYDIDLYPMIWKRNPSTYLHSACTFVIDTKHPHYQGLKQLITNWMIDVPMGSKGLIDMTSKLNWDDDLVKKNWYVVDLRANPDQGWKNGVVLKNWNKLSHHAKNRLLFELYEKVKAVVVFADTVEDVPETITTLSVAGLTMHKDNKLFDFLIKGIFETPRYSVPLNEDLNDTKLYGYHRFEEAPRFTYWPAW